MQTMLRLSILVIRYIIGAFFILCILAFWGQPSIICFALIAALAIPQSNSKILEIIPQLKPVKIQIGVAALVFFIGLFSLTPKAQVHRENLETHSGSNVTVNMNTNDAMNIVENSNAQINTIVSIPQTVPVNENKVPLENRNSNQLLAPVTAPVVAAITPLSENTAKPDIPPALVIPVVKKSTTNICHDQNSPYYLSVENYTSYVTIAGCLESGGRLPNTPESIKKPDPVSAAGKVKKSTSGICHAPGTTYYARTKNFTAYNSLDECLSSGGRLPK